MSAAEGLAKLIRQRYDECAPGRWPMEDSLAEFILEHAAEVGLAVVELPEPDEDNDGQLWFGDVRVDPTGNSGATIHRLFTDISPSFARAQAADYLAAANAAEAVSS